jgi:hypothetical protein
MLTDLKMVGLNILFYFYYRKLSDIYGYDVKGSILIKYLCDEMEKEYLSEKTSPNKESKDLEGILNSVQDIISKETMTSKTEFVKQTIVRNVSLNRRIKFKKSHLPGKVTLRQNDRYECPFDNF